MALTYGDYTIGWITTLDIELAAAKAMLDKPKHPRLPKLPKDDNFYTLGKIGAHNVVVAGLPSGSKGTSPAAHAATNLIRTFPNVKFILMVGIGGGVPQDDVRLGDVFVSNPEGPHGGLVQYDFGTAYQDGFVRKGVLNKPPITVRNALKDLQAEAELEGYHFESHYEEMLKVYPRMADKYSRPSHDRLYQAEYTHTGGDCSGCLDSMLVPREPRSTPIVHYGIIGSANTVVRNAMLRDALYKNDGIKCFEMEAAGLMDIECLVIRGISDYSDSHKNDDWQPYTSAIASAYAKEFLLSMDSQAVDMMPQSKVLESIDERLNLLVEKTERILLAHVGPQEALRWLDAPDFRSNYRTARELREPGTGAWLVESEVYQDWKTGKIRHLWLYGKAGCGKSVLAATIFEDVANYCQTCAMFYFTFSDAKKQTYEDCLRSIVTQMSNREPVGSMLTELYKQRKGPPRDEDLEDIFLTGIEACDQFLLVLDGLDESPETISGNYTTREKLLTWLLKISEKARKLKLLITSRDLLDIRDNMTELEATPSSMVTEFINRDIRRYVATKLEQDSKLRRLNSSMKEKIKDRFTAKADGMFRWAYCQMIELKELQSTRPSHIEAVLERLPVTLDETYERMLLRIQEDLRDDALKLLKWLVYSQGPLTTAELSEALIIDPYDGDGVVNFSDRGSPENLLDLLSGLIILEGRTEMDFNYPGEGYWSSEDDEGSLLRFSKRYTTARPFRHDHIESESAESESTDSELTDSEARVRLAHFSIQEYLESQRILSGKAKYFHLQEKRDQQYLCDCCVVYIAHCTETIITSLPVRYPLFKYVARNWDGHCRKVENVEFQTQFLQCEKALKNWLCVRQVVVRSENWFVTQRCLSEVLPKGQETLHPLYIAAYLGLANIVKVLVLNDNLRECSESHTKFGIALEFAVLRGQAASVEVAHLLIQAGADVTANQCKALYEASRWQNFVMFKFLLDAGADFNSDPAEYKHMLENVAEAQKDELLRMLVQPGSTPRYDAYDAALIIACQQRHIPNIEFLISVGANPNTTGSRWCTTLAAMISQPAPEKDPLILKILLKAGLDVNAFGGLAIFLAIHHGNIEFCRMLLRTEVEVNLSPTEEHVRQWRDLDFPCGHPFDYLEIKPGWSPLIIAASNNFKGAFRERKSIDTILIDLLLGAGASLNYVDREGRNALCHAAESGSEMAVDFLLSKGASLTNIKNRSCLHSAAAGGNLKIVKIFLEHLSRGGIQIDKQLLDSVDVEGRTILHLAARSGNSELFSFLTGLGSDPTVKDKHGRSIFEFACMSGSLELVKIAGTLDKGGGSSWTPLHWACVEGTLELIEYLLDAGQQPRETFGYWPLDVATQEFNYRLGRYKKSPKQISVLSQLANGKARQIAALIPTPPWNRCDGCLFIIREWRYSCQTCNNVIYCSMCKRTSEEMHSDHIWISKRRTSYLEAPGLVT